MSYPILVRRNPGGSAADRPHDLSEALVRRWAIDAHIVQYEGSVRRNKDSVTPEDPLWLTCEFYDFDKKGAPAGWAEECLSRLPEGFVGYRTAGGFRALTLREPFEVGTPEQWEDWRHYHGGRAEALGALIGAEPDHATDEPNRLFRLPLATREDGKPSFGELYGEIGYATLQPVPYARRAATECSTGNASDMLVTRVLLAAHFKPDQCPWQAEHTDGAAGGTVVFPTDDGLGKFHCAHAHCAGRGTPEVLDALGDVPAARAELEAWGLAGAPVKLQPTPLRVLSGAALRAELPSVPWLCRDLQLAPGRPPVLAATANAGKSWSLQCLAMAVCRGTRVFGRFAVQTPGPVVHVCTDAGERATIRKYQQIARAMQCEIPDNLYVIPDRITGLVDTYGQFRSAGLKDLDAFVESCDARLVILDSMFAIAAGLDMNSPNAGAPLYATKDDARTWLWAMHVPKAGGEYFGSAAIGAAAGVMWHIEKSDRKDGARIWTCKKRSEDFEGGADTKFYTTWETEPNDEGLLDAAQIVYLDVAAVSVVDRAQAARERILQALAQNATGLSEKQLQDVAAVARALFLDVLRDLVDTRAIRRVKTGRSWTYKPGAGA